MLIHNFCIFFFPICHLMKVFESLSDSWLYFILGYSKSNLLFLTFIVCSDSSKYLWNNAAKIPSNFIELKEFKEFCLNFKKPWSMSIQGLLILWNVMIRRRERWVFLKVVPKPQNTLGVIFYTDIVGLRYVWY